MARFVKGQSGNPAGRKPGSRNKNNHIWEICDEIGVDPFVVLAEIAAGKLKKTGRSGFVKVGVYTRKEAAAELCQYLMPKLKSIDYSVGQGEGLNVYINTNPPKESPNENEE
jgi:hypothetical protein